MSSFRSATVPIRRLRPRLMSGRGLVVLVVCVSACLSPHVSSAQVPVGTSFTYQGQLTDGGGAANGTYDFQVTLFDASTGGSIVGTPGVVTRDDVTVAGGTFTLSLDFGAEAFGEEKRWLEIGVRPGASTGSYTLLLPRQEISPTPLALHASAAASASTVAGLSCANGDVLKWSAGSWTCGSDADTNGGGTVTGVTAGTGLAGGTITTTGTLSLADGGVTTAKIAGGAVGSAQVNSGQVQLRVTGSCAVGQYIRSIAADGSVTCGTDASGGGASGGGLAYVDSGTPELVVGYPTDPPYPGNGWAIVAHDGGLLKIQLAPQGFYTWGSETVGHYWYYESADCTGTRLVEASSVAHDFGVVTTIAINKQILSVMSVSELATIHSKKLVIVPNTATVAEFLALTGTCEPPGFMSPTRFGPLTTVTLDELGWTPPLRLVVR